MYSLLTHLCDGRTLTIVRGAPDYNGPEAWRQLRKCYQPKTRSRGLALLNEILGWDFGTKEHFLQAHEDWENATLEYNRTASAPLQEEVPVAVLISSISEGSSDIPACASAGGNSEVEPCATVAL